MTEFICGPDTEQLMQIEGTTEFKVLHIPIACRKTFVNIISASKKNVLFWTLQWIKRDKEARDYVGYQRQYFLYSCCYDQTDRLYWINLYNQIDQIKIANAQSYALTSEGEP